MDMRSSEKNTSYQPQIWIHVDIRNQSVSVTDNGTGLSQDPLRLFLQPSMSFKKKGTTRGEKGVGATYLAYGFNYLQVATRTPNFEYIGVLENGREWVEDRDKTIVKPYMRPSEICDPAFDKIDRGASFVVKLTGSNIKTKRFILDRSCECGPMGCRTSRQNPARRYLSREF